MSAKLQLVEKLLQKDRLALARAISHIEDRGEKFKEIVEQLYPHAGNSFIIGITGPPGAGKSTVTDKLISCIRKAGKTVAVTAIDPSSPFSGGAVLGDRIRMQSHIGDAGVYIRSLGTRGKHGGLSQSSREVVLALDAFGFDYILVETAGVGQTELDILKLAHAVCVVLVPESGDSIQVMKAGLMEIADLFVVNKCDRPESDKLVRELITMVGMTTGHELVTQEELDHHLSLPPDATPATSQAARSTWRIPVLKTQALHDKGVEELFAQLLAFQTFALQSNVLTQKRAQFLEDEIAEIITNSITQELREIMRSSIGAALLDAVLQRIETPYKAAEKFKSIILDKKSLK